MLKKEEEVIIKKFCELKYPKSTHELGLDACFDYYNAMCLKLLKNKKNFFYDIEPIPDELKRKIENFIEKDSKNNYLSDMKEYYELLKSIIKILKKES